MSFRVLTRLSLCCFLAFALACNDDDKGDSDADANPVGPGTDGEENTDAAVFAEIGAAFEQAVGLLFVGGGAVPGADRSSSPAAPSPSRITRPTVSSSSTAR
jgi:hypothetical protein